ncbi:hypothetical protein F4780DRAFT_769180 [Xylariomycetidae sp. FL0641]|nr:hypothetical protein F4780DRAFT_769180 [Xylariomycetidae sp. FL0641]
MADQTYDFIVVGAGPAGSALAAGLARAAARPTVLLLEAGGANDDPGLRVSGQRFLTAREPGLAWGYATAPQARAGGRALAYTRGRGLGGSSAVNFSVFTRGARDDYAAWAARAGGDPDFAWDRMRARYARLEAFDPTMPPGVDPKYGAAAAPEQEEEQQGKASGPPRLPLSYAAEWEPDLLPLVDLFVQAGHPLNPDPNSGDPLGVSLCISSFARGRRAAAQDLLGPPAPANLAVVTDAPARRVVLDGKRAVGVESSRGRTFRAAKEVVLCAGALDSPHILMHSGIGPRDQLDRFAIPVVRDAAMVGQGLRDHWFSPLAWSPPLAAGGPLDNAARGAFYAAPAAAQAAAQAQWAADGTGPWARFACEFGLCFAKLAGLGSWPEVRALPAAERARLRAPTVPHVEILTHFPVHYFAPGLRGDAVALLVFLLNAQARGAATLQSADPAVPLRFDPRVLSDPFDRRVAVESTRAALRVARGEGFAAGGREVLLGPAGDSDEEILQHWEQTVSSSYHMTGTVKMGRKGEPDAAVDSDFRVLGIEGLRVADMSVVPVLMSGHTQAPAYVTGMTCADKLVREYGLG